MVRRQKPPVAETIADKSSRSGSLKGRKARTPIDFSPSEKGSGVTVAPKNQKSGITRFSAIAGTNSEIAELAAQDATQGRLRDIGELTFGRREAPVASIPPGGPVTSAANRDERTRATELREPPWRKICDLLIVAADGTLHSGTGWFISPRTLVTAGHCIFVYSPGNPAHGLVRGIRVMPARNGENNAAQSLFGWAEAPRQNLRVHPRWANNRELDFDYGAIVLPPNAPLGQQVGSFGYGHFLDQDLDESAPVLSGYPDNVPEGTQWFERNLIKQVTPNRVFYDIFTSTGQSGSPLFFRNNNRDIACAIHNYGDVPLNSGVRINPAVVAQLNTWRV